MGRGMGARRIAAVAAIAALAVVVVPSSAMADGTVVVANATEFVTAFADPTTDRIELAADVTLAGEAVRPNSADPLVIDGLGFTLSTSANSRILETFGATGALTLENITITGANPPIGQGGAVHWVGGNVTVRNSTFFDNNAASQGAAILMSDDLVVENSTFDMTNTGAIFGPATVTVTNSTFTRNLGTGAIRAGDVTVTNSTFSGNQAVLGGAVSANNLTLIDSTVTGNTAGTDGGGVAAGGVLEVIRSTISGNTAGTFAGGSAGGVYNNGTETFIVNSTITGNTALERQGGGLFYAGEATVVYSDIAGNTAPDGENISTFENEGTLAVFGSVIGLPGGGGANCTNVGSDTSLGYAYEAGGDSCGFGNGAGDVVDGADPQLGALGANGGPTDTRVPAAGSALIDAIPVAACQDGPAADVTTDQRGITRPQGPGCDIGAVEVAAEAPSPPGPAGAATPLTAVRPRFTG